MSKKDFFSGHSKLYATFRPVYPDALYDFIFRFVPRFDTTWDCATGNGQVARHLSKYFKHVYATDISQQQLDNAYRAENIIYSVSSAEQTPFNQNQFDLITVGQAMHWFELDKFYTEVKRVAKPDAIIASWGYSLCSVNPAIDKFVNDFYWNTVGPYWDTARKIVEDQYVNLAFPFEKIDSPAFSIEVEWTLDEFAGYLTTWSATQKYIKSNGVDPVPAVIEKIAPLWKNRERINFPVFLKLGKVH